MTDKALHNGSDPAEERRPLRLAGHEYLWPLFFLLSMSMMGLLSARADNIDIDFPPRPL